MVVVQADLYDRITDANEPRLGDMAAMAGLVGCVETLHATSVQKIIFSHCQYPPQNLI